MDISAPEGVGKNDFVLSTPYYSLKSDISPKLSETNVTKIKVGDAIELKVTQEAKNVPDILLEPLYFSEDPHLKIYREEPILKSKSVGSETRATRTDTFTFVAGKEGNVSIPSQTFIWWDPLNEVLHKEKTEALHFIILAAPRSDASLTPSEEGKEELPWALNLFLILMLIAVLYKFIPIIQKKKEEAKIVYMQSEEGRFRSLLYACQGSDARTLYHDLYYWLEVASPKLSRLGFRGIEEAQPSFSGSLGELEAVLSVQEQSFDKIRFTAELKKFREMLLKEQQQAKQGLPDKINP